MRTVDSFVFTSLFQLHTKSLCIITSVSSTAGTKLKDNNSTNGNKGSPCYKFLRLLKGDNGQLQQTDFLSLQGT